MIWWQPPLERQPRTWLDTPTMRATEFKGMATIVIAKRLFVPGFNEPPANDRDRLKW
jgi:hypothetical protein